MTFLHNPGFYELFYGKGLTKYYIAGRPWNVVYNYKGEVFCVNPNEDEQREMAYGGFEKDRGTLKYRCPAKEILWV